MLHQDSSTHQGRLPQELALKGMTEIEAANRYLQEHYLPVFNEEFSHLAREEGTAFVPLAGVNPDEYLCERYPRIVSNDNCIKIGNHRRYNQADKPCVNYSDSSICPWQ